MAGQPQPRPELPVLMGLAPPVIVRQPGSTAHGQIEEWLGDAIAAGQLLPGDRMPTEYALAGWLGVSRMTLRHALANLARRGLVVRTVGRNGGTFVAEGKLEQDRTTLAGFSEQLRRHGLVAGARVLSATARTASPAVAAALDLAERRPGDRDPPGPAGQRAADRGGALGVPGRAVPGPAAVPAGRVAV